MKAGIISDSHDSLASLDEAVKILAAGNIDYLIHAGDFIAPFTIPHLAKSGAREVYAVFGNNDGEKKGLTTAFGRINGKVFRAPYKFTLEGLGILLMHEPYFIADGFSDPEVRVSVFGHTHKASIEERQNTTVINPGEICGYISGKRTLVLLDWDGSEVKTEIVEF